MALETQKIGLTMYSSRTQHLLVVGDIHGFPETFVELLDAGCFEHRVLELADLSGRPGLHGDDLHDHLVNKDGMQHAVRALREINGRTCFGIGFSSGGTALWGAVKEGLEIQALICVSSTRLRLETSALNIPTMVFWGELDPHRPTEKWNDAVPGYCKTYPGKHHDFYRVDALAPYSPLRTDIGAFIESVSLHSSGPAPAC
ncbi:alpha/beta hydrolase [Rhizobium mesoamericanum]|uniref:alpha/beta hydrolase n=1 Tax=Rhizobium mesoamericanum TaxID=1079800 RepID=UPI001F465894|nr:alpha/beta hydrolase [Rhizobium mesoamericanum]